MSHDLKARLLAACNGNPYAKIQWPHYLLHEAHDRIAELEAAGQALAAAYDACSASYDHMGNEGPNTDELSEAVHEKFNAFRLLI